MANYINVIDNKGKRKHTEISDDVWIYILALEYRIKYPDKSKIHETYPERFKKQV